jgi:hypothetical protein
MDWLISDLLAEISVGEVETGRGQVSADLGKGVFLGLDSLKVANVRHKSLPLREVEMEASVGIEPSSHRT